MKSYKRIGLEIGKLVQRKNEAYGDAFGKTAAMLKILYPTGISVFDYEDIGLIVRVLDKLSRIAIEPEAFGESPYADIAGYMILAEKQRLDKKIKDDKWLPTKPEVSE